MKERGNKLLRRMDAVFGVPLLLALGLLRRRRSLPHPIRSIGILRSACMGDTVLLSAIVEDLRAAFPEARFRFFAGETNFATAKLFMKDDEMARIRVTAPLAASRALRQEKLDLLLDFGPWPRVDALIAAFSGAGCTVGFNTPGQARHSCYDIAVQHDSQVHELTNYRRVIRALGVTPTHEPIVRTEGGPVIELPRYLVFHLWPGGYLSHQREWAVESWIELARLAALGGYSVVLTGLKSDQARTQAIVEQMPSGQAENLAGQFDVAGTARLLRYAAAVVSVNTGIMHLAAAIGTPTVGLSGPTSVQRWGAIGRNVCNVAAETPGCGYLNLGFEYRRQRTDCMTQICVSSVWAGLQEVLSVAVS